jgi:DNA-binding transcriptional MerR regulator
MPRPQDLHTSDLCRALDAPQHKIRGWVTLEPLGSRKRKHRSATAYSGVDLLFLGVIKILDDAGFSLKGMRSFSALIYREVQRPISTDQDELVLHLTDNGTWKTGLAPAGLPPTVEIKAPLQHVRLQLLEYTSAHQISGQTEMNLLASVQGARSPGSASGLKAKRKAR